MTKKILLIIGILVIVGVVLFLIFGSKPQTTGENEGEFSIRDYLPFGRSEDLGTSSTTVETIIEEEGLPDNQENKPIPRLRKISSEPVAGAVVFNIGTTSVARFVEKGTGNVYEAKSDTAAIARLTNTTIPKIARTFWLPDGSGFLAQTLLAESELIETNFVKLNKNAASSTDESLTPFGTVISKLPTDIKEISVKPDGTKIFYYTVNGSSNWFIANPDGTKSSQLISHPLTEWIPKWISGNVVIMQIKGSSEANGYAYSFDVSTKVLKRVGVEALGLSVNLNSDGSLSLISSGGNIPKLFIVDNKKVSTKEISANTLAEKCVWLKEKSPSVFCAVPNQVPRGNYPDIWYKGLIATEDSITKINVSDDILYNIADLTSLASQMIDVTDMSISPDENHLIFRNKIDGFLWMLRIEE